MQPIDTAATAILMIYYSYVLLGKKQPLSRLAFDCPACIVLLVTHHRAGQQAVQPLVALSAVEVTVRHSLILGRWECTRIQADSDRTMDSKGRRGMVEMDWAGTMHS